MSRLTMHVMNFGSTGTDFSLDVIVVNPIKTLPSEVGAQISLLSNGVDGDVILESAELDRLTKEFDILWHRTEDEIKDTSDSTITEARFYVQNPQKMDFVFSVGPKKQPTLLISCDGSSLEITGKDEVSKVAKGIATALHSAVSICNDIKSQQSKPQQDAHSSRKDG